MTTTQNSPLGTTPDTTLLVNGRVHAPAPDATAMAVRDGTVLWVGSDEEAVARFADARVVRLDGALVTPAFVDAHVHATSAGLLLTGLDLTACGSLDECLDAVRRFAAASDDPVLWGHGWDETRWPQRRPPSRAELDEAAGGRPVYLSRVDMHSALATSPLSARAAGTAGYSPDAPLSQEAHHVVRREAQAALTAAQRQDAQRAFLAFAASRGVGAVHECGGPEISSVDDLHDLLAAHDGPDVVGYWSQLVSAAEEATELLASTGAHGLAGDLFCDGAIGSRTASLHTPYTDAPHTSGAAYLDAGQVAGHVAACTAAGAQAGFHAIGDAAVSTVVAGFALAADRVGTPALVAARHRVEHLEMVTPGQAAQLAGYGVLASVQPQFDAFWGGPDDMYAQRLGVERALRLNPFAMLAEAGVDLAFGSDVPVTPLDPWATVRAAVHHRTPGSGLSAPAALAAHTAGGHRAAGVHGSDGVLTAAAPASFAVWAVDSLQAAVDGESPTCLATVVRGRVIHDREGTLRR